MPRKHQPRYRSEGLTGIDPSRVSSFAAAARKFATRLGRNLFGRSGQMFSLKRLYPERRQPRLAALYWAEVGTKRGPRTELEFWVTLG